MKQNRTVSLLFVGVMKRSLARVVLRMRSAVCSHLYVYVCIVFHKILDNLKTGIYDSRGVRNGTRTCKVERSTSVLVLQSRIRPMCD